LHLRKDIRRGNSNRESKIPIATDKRKIINNKFSTYTLGGEIFP